MKTVGEFMAHLAEAAGIDLTDESWKEVLGIQIALPGDAGRELSQKLMTEEAAKNRDDLKKHYLSEFMTARNADMDRLMKKKGVDQETRDKVFAIGAAQERYAAFTEAIAAASAKTLEGDAETIRKQIEALNSQIEAERSRYESERNQIVSQYESEMINEAILREAMSKTWSTNYSEDLRPDLAKVAIDKKFAEIGVKVIRDPQTKRNKLVKIEDPKLDYFENNKKVEVSELVARAIDPFLAKTPTPPSGTQQQTQAASAKPLAGSSYKDKATAFLDEQINNLQNS